MPIVAGLDVGFRNTGVVLAELLPDCTYRVLDHKCFSTKKAAKKMNLYVVDDDIHSCVSMLTQLWDYTRDRGIDLYAVEMPTGGSRGARSARTMGIASGMIATYSAVCTPGTPFLWVRPMQTKIKLCGSQKASKESIQEAVISAYPDYPWPRGDKKFEHIADAMGALMVAADSEMVKLLSRKG